MLNRTPLIAMSVLLAIASFGLNTATAGERPVRIIRKETTRKVVKTTKTVTRRATPAPVHREHEYRNARHVAYRSQAYTAKTLAHDDYDRGETYREDVRPVVYYDASARYDNDARHVQPVSHRSRYSTSVHYSSGYYGRPRHYYGRPVHHYPRYGYGYGHRYGHHGGHSGLTIGFHFRF